MPLSNSDPQLRRAYAYAIQYGIAESAYQAYRSQRNGARKRQIDFIIEFCDWWVWWQTDDPEHGIRWDKRGVGAGKLVMARFGDTGPYSLDNIYCASHAKNLEDIDPEKRSKAQKESWKDGKRTTHLSERGDAHPKSRAVITPVGRFGSAALAAEHFGITRTGASKKARNKISGWYYEGEAPPDTISDRYEFLRRSVMTPAGEFPSVKEAAEHYGVTPACAGQRAKRNADGWYYVDAI